MFNELTGSVQYIWSKMTLSSTESKKEGQDQASIQSSTWLIVSILDLCTLSYFETLFFVS